MNTWHLKRLTNKPHIRIRNREYIVALRPGFDMQAHMQRRFAAHRFCMDHNREVYKDGVERNYG